MDPPPHPALQFALLFVYICVIFCVSPWHVLRTTTHSSDVVSLVFCIQDVTLVLYIHTYIHMYSGCEKIPAGKMAFPVPC